MALNRREFPPRKSLPDNRQSTSVVLFLLALFSLLVSMSFLLSVPHFSLLIAWLLIKIASFLADRTNELTVLVQRTENGPLLLLIRRTETSVKNGICGDCARTSDGTKEREREFSLTLADGQRETIKIVLPFGQTINENRSIRPSVFLCTALVWPRRSSA